MSSTKIIGIVLLLAGAGVAFWGYQLSTGMSSQLSSAFNNSPSDAVMYRYIGGAVLAVVGAALLVRK